MKREVLPVTPGIGRTLLYDASPLDSGIYNGDLKHGRPHGHGSIIYFVDDIYDRANYTGGWINGTRHGTGRTLWSDGTLYQGQYKAGWEQGIGVLRQGSEQYEGEFQDGKKHGKGIIVRDNGQKFKGTWINGALAGNLLSLSERVLSERRGQISNTARGGSRSFKFKTQKSVNPDFIKWRDRSVKMTRANLKEIYANVNRQKTPDIS